MHTRELYQVIILSVFLLEDGLSGSRKVTVTILFSIPKSIKCPKYKAVSGTTSPAKLGTIYAVYICSHTADKRKNALEIQYTQNLSLKYL